MTYDQNVPLQLKREQQWFGSVIGRPIDQQSRINPISPSGQSIEEEAAQYILPGPKLRPAERIQIYNQQYWWRLLNALHETFSLVVRLIGYVNFNRLIGIPYLVKCPPNHWSLNLLGDRLPHWIEQEYCEENRELIRHAIHIDWAFNDAFSPAELPPLNPDDMSSPEKMEKMLTTTLYLQPHIHLFYLPYPLFDYRMILLSQKPDHWQTHGLPPLPAEEEFFILYRNKQNDISWKKISAGEYHLLGLFKNGVSIDQACEWLEQQDSSLCQTAMNSLQQWFQEWTARGWLSTKV